MIQVFFTCDAILWLYGASDVRKRRLKAAVHWVRVNALSAESSPKLTWDAMGLRADSARWLSVRAEPLTRCGRAESARNPIAANVKFSD